ncbi:hypothetical protein Hanom_Chr10g00908201 [Helianthus anomalus]
MSRIYKKSIFGSRSLTSLSFGMESIFAPRKTRTHDLHFGKCQCTISYSYSAKQQKLKESHIN